MDRREFLKKAGLGSAAIAGLPGLEAMLATPAWANNSGRGRGFFFVVVSHSTTTSALIAISGCGSITRRGIEGGGSFTHFVPEGDPPFPIEATGNWRATKLLSFEPIGSYGTLIAGIGEWEAIFRVTSPFRAQVPATLEMVCNLEPAGLINPGEEEGVMVSVPAAGQTFVQNVPPTGLTLFTSQFAGG